MRKQMIKKLYTYYTVEADLDEIKNNPDYILVSYSGRKATCIRYHKTVSGWLEEITAGDFKNGFGLALYTEDCKCRLSNYSQYSYECNNYTCSTSDKELIVQKLANILEYYFNSTNCYYEIEYDDIYMHTELTGHMYYRSPYESCDDCGNCDGARCESCRTKYIVEGIESDSLYYTGYDKDKAKQIRDENQKDYSDIVADLCSTYDVSADDNVKNNYEYVINLFNGACIPYFIIHNSQ